MPEPLRLRHTALTVADLDASTAWYMEVLGMESAFSEVSAERRATVLRIPGGEEIDIPHGGILNFKDPDGIALSFFWDRPTDEAS